MGVSYQGMDCIKDMELSEYMDAKMKSQAEVPWAYQTNYGYYTLYWGCAFIIVTGIKHLYYRSRDSRYKTTMGINFIDQFMDIISGYSRYFGYMNIPSRISYFTSLPPSGGNSMFLLATTIYLSLWSFVPHFWYRECRGFGSPPLAVRTGIMATALTPFIYILGGKTNFITLMTGISYEKLNYLHQYVGVAALVLSLIHTIPFVYQALAEGGHANLAESFDTDFYFISGIPPLVLLILLCTLSKSFIRKWFYEIFWHVHWVMGAGYFATLTWHVYGQLGTTNYMWTALAFWFGQLFYRILIKTCFRPNSLFMKSRKSQLFKLIGSKAFEINMNSKGINWKPGQHAFIRFKSKIIDNHPFSIVNLPSNKLLSEQDKNIESGSNEDENIKFIVVPKKGLTKKLYEEIENNTSNYITKDVYFDGPYGGSPRDHNSFDKVILIATGSGITATLSFLIDLVRNIKSGNNKVTKEIEFVWIVKYIEDIEWVKPELLQCVGDYVNLNIYVAHKSEEKIVEEKTSEVTTMENDLGNLSSSDVPGLNIHFFKPNVKETMEEFKYSLKRRNMIVSSGSDSMKFEVSSVASSFQTLVINNYAEEVFLHTESFSW